MRVDVKDKVWFVNKKERRAIRRVHAMMSAVCSTTTCTDCPLKVESGCINHQFHRRFMRRAILEEKE